MTTALAGLDAKTFIASYVFRRTTGHAFCYLEVAGLTAQRTRMHIGIRCDPAHDRTWIVAMSEKPGYLTALDHAGCWGIQPIFSAFEPRGCGVENAQIHYPDRVARLLLVMALALYSTVYTGLWEEANDPTPDEKVLSRQPAKVARSKMSWFTRGLRRVVKLMQALLPWPPFWITEKLVHGQRTTLTRGHTPDRSPRSFPTTACVATSLPWRGDD